jgi:glycerol-3-phosphate O-acyltransferase
VDGQAAEKFPRSLFLLSAVPPRQPFGFPPRSPVPRRIHGRRTGGHHQNIPENAIIVYTSKYKSGFDFLFAHTRYRQQRLPVPQLVFDSEIYLWQPLSRAFRVCLAYLDELIQRHRIHNPYRSGYYERALLSSGCALLPLVEKKGFYRRFVKEKIDPLRYLIEIQKKTDRPVYLVPQLFFYTKKPLPAVPSLVDMFFGSSQRPGKIRKIVTLIRHPGKIFVELSQPLNLRQWLSQPAFADRSDDYMALQLRRELLLQHNRHRQSITGPILKSGEEIKEAILTGETMQHFLKKHAAARKEPIHKIRKKADGYLDEIAARYSPFVIRMLNVVVGWIINSMFDGAVIDKPGLAKVKAMSQKGPLILIPCHKSHVDYLILSYILYHNNMPCPHIAAGKNLSFWPLGPIFRGGGAFFLRRTFKGAILYARVFSAYIHKLLEEGFNVELFIEGGRSRTGKLLNPKLGLISILLDAYRNGACEDMIFVPVYIGYDRIIEEHAYIHEVEGGKKESENLSQVIRARRFLKKRYGKIYINYHEPIAASEFLDGQPTPFDRMSAKEVNALIRQLGWRIVNAIDKQTVVTPHGLVAAAILNIARPRFTHEELLETANTYLTFAMSQKAKLADTFILDPDRAMDVVVDHYLSRKLLENASKRQRTSGRSCRIYGQFRQTRFAGVLQKQLHILFRSGRLHRAGHLKNGRLSVQRHGPARRTPILQGLFQIRIRIRLGPHILPRSEKNDKSLHRRGHTHAAPHHPGSLSDYFLGLSQTEAVRRFRKTLFRILSGGSCLYPRQPQRKPGNQRQAEKNTKSGPSNGQEKGDRTGRIGIQNQLFQRTALLCQQRHPQS